MLDIKFIRENPDAVRENIKKKFQDAKLPLVDQVLALDEENRAAVSEANELRANRNALSKQVGMLMGQAKKDPSKLEEAEAVKAQVKARPGKVTHGGTGSAGALALLFHELFKLRHVNFHSLFRHNLLCEVYREAVCVVEFESIGTGKQLFARFLMLVHEPV